MTDPTTPPNPATDPTEPAPPDDDPILTLINALGPIFMSVLAKGDERRAKQAEADARALEFTSRYDHVKETMDRWRHYACAALTANHDAPAAAAIASEMLELENVAWSKEYLATIEKKPMPTPTEPGARPADAPPVAVEHLDPTPAPGA